MADNMSAYCHWYHWTISDSSVGTHISIHRSIAHNASVTSRTRVPLP